MTASQPVRVSAEVSELVLIACGGELHPGKAVAWDANTANLTIVDHDCSGCAPEVSEDELRAARAELVELISAQLRKIAEAESRRPAKGKRVKAVRGKKPPQGLVGVVRWAGEHKFAAEDAAFPYTYGVEVEEDPTGTYQPGEWVFGYESVSGRPRFEVLDAEEHMPAESEIRERAERIARWSWWTPFARDI